MSGKRAAQVTLADAADLPHCQSVRHEVFVKGQGVPAELDADGLDPQCIHFVARIDGRVVGTARLRDVAGAAKAERVAVLEPERGLGTGRALMLGLESEARARGYTLLVLSAQETVTAFYERLGYRVESERFFEAGIPHRKMSKTLRDPLATGARPS
jgi:predicted GNAT family N-acyltransferase